MSNNWNEKVVSPMYTILTRMSSNWNKVVTMFNYSYEGGDEQ